MSAKQDYNRVLYPGIAYSQTHPDRLATLATLFGLSPAPPARCHVLEIGCTDGGNLIPMAYGLPDAEFVGIDVSTRALAAGRDSITALGLKNIRLLELDILDVPPDFGAFDYIIAHGVYSWVPDAVREKLLAICRNHLAPQGVAYISYNAYPGCHLRDMVRGMMCYHVGAIDDPDEKRRHATALLRFVAEGQPGETHFGKIVAAELERIEERTDAAFYHDDLAEFRTAFYFHEFIAQAAAHGLQYLSEAAIYEMEDRAFGPAVTEALGKLASDRIAREQYLDFLRGRRFRQTLLCRACLPVGTPRAEAVRGYFISSPARPASVSPTLDNSTIEAFAVPGEGGARLETAHALAKAAVVHLAETWPRLISFDELLAAARAKLGENAAPFASTKAATEFADALLAMYSAGLLQFSTHVPAFTTEITSRPVASPVARMALGRGARAFTSTRHVSVPCEDPLAARLLTLLDGTRDIAALTRELQEFAASRGIDAQIAESQVEESLRKLARMAVLVG
jgi:SAM-dependent methyltransferase